MRNLKFKQLWHLIGYTYILIIFYLCLRRTSGGQQPFLHFDKILHFSAYFFLMSYFVQIIKTTALQRTFLLFILMGILIEFLQLLSGYRNFEILDIMANTLGLICGGLLSKKRFPNMIESLENILDFSDNHRS